MIESILSYKLPVVVTVFAVFFFLERRFAVAQQMFEWSRCIANFGLLVVNGVLSLLVVLPLTAWASSHALSIFAVPDSIFWFCLHVLLLDLWIYSWHRANHRIPFLWRFHRVHHLDQQLDTSSAVRFHFGEVLLSALLRALVVWVFAIPFTTVLLFEVLVLFAAIWHHSNVRIPHRIERALSWVIVTPSIHWVHHHVEQKDTDSNYSTVFSVWDRLFASRSCTERTPDLRMGLDDRSDQSLMSLLALPFFNAGVGGKEEKMHQD